MKSIKGVGTQFAPIKFVSSTLRLVHTKFRTRAGIDGLVFMMVDRAQGIDSDKIRSLAEPIYSLFVLPL